MEGQYRKRCLGFAQQHDAAVPGELWCQPLDKRNEARVYKEEAVRRMVDNVHDLVIEQPRVDGVTDGAYTRAAVIQLEMPEAIFQARVPTLSPGLIPSRNSARASRLDRRSASA